MLLLSYQNVFILFFFLSKFEILAKRKGSFLIDFPIFEKEISKKNEFFYFFSFLNDLKLHTILTNSLFLN